MTSLALMLLGQIYVSTDGGAGYLVRRLNITGAGVACATSAGVGSITVAGGGGSVPAGCPVGQALTSDGGVVACTSAITASGIACSGACVSSAEIENVAGSKVEGAVSLATALASDPSDCSAGQYATGINASGVPACAQVATSQLSGTISDGQLASNYSGVGGCTNQFVRASNDNAAPTCASVGIADHSATGTPSGSTFLRGDNVWATPSGGSGVLAQVTGANYTNGTVTPSTVVSWSVSASTQYGFYCSLTSTGTATSLPRFNLTGPASTNVSFLTQRFTTTSAQTLLVLQALSASAQTAACTSSCNTTQLPTIITGSFIVGGTGGAMSLQAASSTAGQTVTVFRGSYCRVF